MKALFLNFTQHYTDWVAAHPLGGEMLIANDAVSAVLKGCV